MLSTDFVVVGGGIVGLATAHALSERFPAASLALLEKESSWGAHQTGHNSGVIHSGIYYGPGSLKARTAVRGRRLLTDFCVRESIPHRLCGKAIVATEREELPGLRVLHDRGRENGLNVELINRDRLREIEPHAEGIAAIWVPEAGIVDYRRVAAALARRLEERGASLHLAREVVGIESADGGLAIDTHEESVRARFLVNCTGLHSDRVARMAGVLPRLKIVPFRGEYFEVVPERRHLVKGLVYPVPDPRFPFLGVHFTRMIDGTVEAGPNAVLSLKREGYEKGDFALGDALDSLTYSGFWRLAGRHWRAGAREVARSHSKRLFVNGLRRLVPEIGPDDLVPAPAGVRAQALDRAGRLVDDFLLLDGHRSLHVCNAPSPAATASMAIGEAIVDRIPDRYGVPIRRVVGGLRHERTTAGLGPR